LIVARIFLNAVMQGIALGGALLVGFDEEMALTIEGIVYIMVWAAVWTPGSLLIAALSLRFLGVCKQGVASRFGWTYVGICTRPEALEQTGEWLSGKKRATTTSKTCFDFVFSF
jgi:hypothetical protein